jgi:hypothetical protein
MDNHHNKCPPKMSDKGRHLGDFQTSTRRNEQIKYVNGIYRDDEYRLFLQQNGLCMMRENYIKLRAEQSCAEKPPCVHTGPTRQSYTDIAAERTRYENRFNAPDECPDKKDFVIFEWESN